MCANYVFFCESLRSPLENLRSFCLWQRTPLASLSSALSLCVVLLCEVQSSYWMALDQANEQSAKQPASLPASHPTSQPANQPASQSTSVALVPSRTIKRASTSSSATLPHAHFSFCCCGCGCDCCCVAVVAFRLAFSVALWKAARRATAAPAPAAAEATRCGLTSNPSPLFSRIRRSSSSPTPPQSYWQLNYFSAWQTKAYIRGLLGGRVDVVRLPANGNNRLMKCMTQ